MGYDAGLNLYEYVGDDPVDKTDPTGNNPVVAAALAGCAADAETGCIPGMVIGGLVTWWVVTHPIQPDQGPIHHNEQAPAGDKKPPPNPNGSRGSQEHQDKIKDRIRDLIDQGHTHEAGGDKPEETVATPGGEKGSRRPDIKTTDPTGSPYRENVGRQTQGGDPVARERRAQDDIQRATGQCAFTPYNSCK